SPDVFKDPKFVKNFIEAILGNKVAKRFIDLFLGFQPTLPDQTQKLLVERTIPRANSPKGELKLSTRPILFENFAYVLPLFPNYQLHFAEQFRLGRFGAQAGILEAFVENLKCFNMPAAVLSVSIGVMTDRLKCQGVGGPTEARMEAVYLQILRNLPHFQISPTAVLNIVTAFQKGLLGKTADHIDAFLASPSTFIGPRSQLLVARMISGNRIARQLPTELDLSWIVLSESAKANLISHISVFTFPPAQAVIARAIADGRLSPKSASNTPTYLRRIAEQLNCFTDIEAQQVMGSLIKRGFFGEDPSTLEVVAANIRHYTSDVAQEAIVDAIQKKKFGNSPRTLYALSQIHFLHRRNPKILQDLVLGAQIARADVWRILSELKSELRQVKPQDPQSSTPKYFGMVCTRGDLIVQALTNRVRPNRIDHEVANSLVEDHLNYLWAGFGNAPSVIHTAAETDAPPLLPQAEASLLFFLPADGQVIAEYNHTFVQNNHFGFSRLVRQLVIYDFSKLTAGYPSRILGSELNPRDPLFPKLPAWVRTAVEDSAFDPNEYQHCDLVRYVAESIPEKIKARLGELNRDSDQLFQLFRLIVNACVRQSDRMAISDNPENEIEIKQRINDLFEPIEDEIIHEFKSEIASLKNAELAMVAFLLGRLAQSGVLGFHIGTNNQSNRLFYRLAAAAFIQLSERSPIPDPDFDSNEAAPGLVTTELLSDLHRGVCIGTICNDFQSTPGADFVAAIFSRRN
ncbi:hypothetical protein EBR96_05795, partial [bacterium]|nr:hypothetical protein [bacterium]